jgi:hypothetical protein
VAEPVPPSPLTTATSRNLPPENSKTIIPNDFGACPAHLNQRSGQLLYL